MTTPTNLADWANHCRAEATKWDAHTRSAANAGANELAQQHDNDAAAWRGFELLLQYVSRSDAMPEGAWPELLADAAGRVAAHLPTTEETDLGVTLRETTAGDQVQIVLSRTGETAHAAPTTTLPASDLSDDR